MGHDTIFPDTLVKKEVQELPKYNSGMSDDAVAEKYQVGHIIRLASNENPFGTSPLALSAARKNIEKLWKYSDADSTGLRKSLSCSTGIDYDRIVIGNGSEELIALLCRACLHPGDRVVTIHPSFLLHEIYPMEQGAKVVAVPISMQHQFDVEGMIDQVRKGCRMLIFSNPSNPVGTILTTDRLTALLEALPQESLIVIDEAYYEYGSFYREYPDSLKILKERSNPSVVLRTFSKVYGLAGCRVGYGLFSDSWFADQIQKLRTPFNVNHIAQVAAHASLNDTEHVGKSVRAVNKERSRITHLLRSRGCVVADSWANFLFIDCGHDSMMVAEKLLEKGIIVKPWTAEGFSCYLRVTVGSEKDNDRFLDALFSLIGT